MSDRHSLAPATKQELENARTKGQVIGFAQGLGTALVAGLAMKFLGWIPIVLVVGAVAWVVYKLVAGREE
jgi:hypothetical protein